MKKFTLLLSILVLFAACADIPVRPVQSFVDEIRNEYSPDSRTMIFKVEFSQSGKVITLDGEMNSIAGHDSLISRLQREGYTVADKIRLLPSDELAGKIYGVVNRSVANLRVEPSERSEMASQAVLGTPLRVYKKQGGQYLVQTPDDYLGWMEEDAFTAMTPKQFGDWLKSEKIIYLADQGYVYKKADKNSAPITDITATSLVKALDIKPGFVRIELPDGRSGYVEREACEHFEYWATRTEYLAGQKSKFTDSIIAKAKSFMGCSYLWGGTSTKMMDCSGFTRIVYLLHGIYLPRDASQQVFVGKTVAEGKEQMDRLKPGDLLFFGRVLENGKERITHTGIYLGNDLFIHESGVVAIESFNPEHENYSAYRHNQFIRAKDVVNYIGKLGVMHVFNHPLFFREELYRPMQ